MMTGLPSASSQSRSTLKSPTACSRWTRVSLIPTRSASPSIWDSRYLVKSPASLGNALRMDSISSLPIGFIAISQCSVERLAQECRRKFVDRGELVFERLTCLFHGGHLLGEASSDSALF